jgi:hypothetical protein
MTTGEALLHVQEAVEAENYTVRDHFYDRMNLRGMFWPDVSAVVASPSNIRTDGTDEYGRERWFFKGMTTAQSEIEILVVFEGGSTGSPIFWTIYWDD